MLPLGVILFYLEGFKFSNNNIIKYIQIIFIICLLISPLIIGPFNHNHFITDVMYCIDDKEKINLQGQVNIDKETLTTISEGAHTIGEGLNNLAKGIVTIGVGGALTGAIVGVSKVIGGAVTHSSIPPAQKAIIIVTGGVLAG